MNPTSNPNSSSQAFLALQTELIQGASALRLAITEVYRRDEQASVNWLLANIKAQPASAPKIQTLAHELVSSVRQKRTRASGVDALMHEFSLSSEEGVAIKRSAV